MCPTGTSLSRANITSEATSEFRGAFEVIDVDHDGKISGEDLRSFYASFSGSGNDEDEEIIRSMIVLADSNKDGYVQYEEFEKVLKEKRGSGNGKEKVYVDEYEYEYDGGMMEEVFKVMDKDGDGRLGVDDLKSYLSCAGIKVEDDEINAMIKLGCNEGDVRDGVSFHGFLNILKLHDFES